MQAGLEDERNIMASIHNNRVKVEGLTNTDLDAAVKILRDTGKPLHYKEITLWAITSKMIIPSGKTPAGSMNSQISTDIKHKDADSKFIMVKAGVYGLNPKNDTKSNERVAETQNVVEQKNTQFVGKGQIFGNRQTDLTRIQCQHGGGG